MQQAQLRAKVDSAPLFRARYFGPMCHIPRPRRARAPGPPRCAAARPGPAHVPYVLHSMRVNSLGHAIGAVARRSRLCAFVPRAVSRPQVPRPRRATAPQARPPTYTRRGAPVPQPALALAGARPGVCSAHSARRPPCGGRSCPQGHPAPGRAGLMPPDLRWAAAALKLDTNVLLKKYL